jgi:hypothetical protein
MKVKRNLPALEATKCRWRKASVPQRGAAEPQPKKDSPQIAMSLRLAADDENGRFWSNKPVLILKDLFLFS